MEQEHILQFFAFEHLPEDLKAISRPFCALAHDMVATLPRNPERTVALRKLLEAKDAAVRAQLAALRDREKAAAPRPRPTPAELEAILAPAPAEPTSAQIRAHYEEQQPETPQEHARTTARVRTLEAQVFGLDDKPSTGPTEAEPVPMHALILSQRCEKGHHCRCRFEETTIAMIQMSGECCVHGEVDCDYAPPVRSDIIKSPHGRSEPTVDTSLRTLLMLGGRVSSPEETLDCLKHAAWEMRRDGGCHSRTSEVLTTWERELRALFNTPGGVAPCDALGDAFAGKPQVRPNMQVEYGNVVAEIAEYMRALSSEAERQDVRDGLYAVYKAAMGDMS